MADRLRVNSSRLGRNLPKDDQSPWQRGAGQIRSFFDDFLGSNPSWGNGLTQLQQQNPSWARGAEQIGSFLTGTPMRQLPQGGRPQPIRGNPRGELIQKQNRRAADRQQPRGGPVGELTDMGQTANFRSFADYLREALEMLGGGGVNYDPQRNALRQNASQADSVVGQIYADLQQQFANSAPMIDQRYAQSGEALDLNTAQAANAVNSSNEAIRNAQTQQLQALGIEDAIANVAPQQAADQANALQSIQQTGQIAGNANDQFGTAARTYNDENKGTAGMEGASKRALLQANLLSALADVDSRESEANASLSNQRQNSALSVAQLLMEQDPEGARAAAAQAEQMQRLAQQQFENEMAVREFDARYNQPQQQGIGLQQALGFIGQGQNIEEMDPKTVSAYLNAISRYKY